MKGGVAGDAEEERPAKTPERCLTGAVGKTSFRGGEEVGAAVTEKKFGDRQSRRGRREDVALARIRRDRTTSCSRGRCSIYTRTMKISRWGQKQSDRSISCLNQTVGEEAIFAKKKRCRWSPKQRNDEYGGLNRQRGALGGRLGRKVRGVKNQLPFSGVLPTPQERLSPDREGGTWGGGAHQTASKSRLKKVKEKVSISQHRTAEVTKWGYQKRKDEDSTSTRKYEQEPSNLLAVEEGGRKNCPHSSGISGAK